jgi:hypothetical protein
MEEPSGGDSGGVSSLRSSPAVAGRLSVLVFSISPPPSFATRWGTLYIVGFRSRRSPRDEDRRHRSHEEKRACPTRPGKVTSTFMVQRLKELRRMHKVITDIQIWLMVIYRREYPVMSVVFSNHRVTHLRVHDAWDGFVNTWKHRVLIYVRVNHSDKV